MNTFSLNKKRVTRKVSLFRPGTPQSQCQLDGAKVVNISYICKFSKKIMQANYNSDNQIAVSHLKV